MPTRAALAFSLAIGTIGCATETTRYDLVLRGGEVTDGTGAALARADVAIADGRIVRVGEIGPARAARELDARGLVIAPGWIDLHSHADLILLGPPAERQRLLAAKVAQGVTTIVVGNCGLGVAPADAEAAALLEPVNSWMAPEGVAAGALTTGEFLARLEAASLPLNVATLVPHGPVRMSEMGLAAAQASVEQISRMREQVTQGLRDGAFGLSVGLIYPPGMYSATDELAGLAEVVAAHDGLFTAHVRGSSETLLDATRELVEIARSSGARVHHSHLEAVGEPFWPRVAEVLALEDAARAAGLRVSHDVFPYTRAATMMSAIFPPWSLEGGVPALLERLGDPLSRRLVRTEIAERVPDWPPWQPGGWPHNLVRAVGWDGIFVASVGSGEAQDLVGRSLDEIAREREADAFDAVADLMLAEDGRVGQLVSEISGRDDEPHPLLEILAHPAAAVVSDAEDYGRGTPHPAHAGAFVRALRLNREHSLMPLGEMVRRMTSYPASLLGLQDRGVLREGAWADLVVFDAASVGDRATWDEPRRTAEGVRWVVIHGQLVFEDGQIAAPDAGRVLRKEN